MKAEKERMGLWEAVALGVGIIIGASIFSMLGVGASIAGSNLPLALLLSSLAALLVAYNYAKLASVFTSNAGPVEYAVQAFGGSLLVGVTAFMLWFTYVGSVALFAKTFAGYAAALLGVPGQPHVIALIEVLVVAAFVALNFGGSKVVGRAEKYMVAVKIGILAFFAAVGALYVDPARLRPDPQRLAATVYAASLFFLSYTGFGLITNASENIEDPKRNVPRAIYLSLLVATVVYVSVAAVAVGTLGPEGLARAEEYALAEAAKPFLGRAGFVLVSLGALVSTASALNATIYGGANAAYALAKKGFLPETFERKKWKSEPEGLYITATLGLAAALLLNLEGVAAVCSATFIVIYLVVIASHYKLINLTKGSRVVTAASFIVVSLVLAVLLYNQYTSNPRALAFIAGAYASAAILEYLLGRRRGRSMLARSQWPRRGKG